MERRNFIKILGTSSALIMGPSFSFGVSVQSSTVVFKDGDTVCFIGDSITHNGTWQVYIANYFITRFPKLKIRFVNCGISGDIAAGALNRLEDDILPDKPDHAIIMLGMNDVHRELYNTASPPTENLEKRKVARESYRSDMEKIATRLKNNGCSSIFLVSPSPYDETSLTDSSNLIKVNEELRNYSDIVKKMSQKYSVSFVDFHGPMTCKLKLLQKKDQKFSFAPHDRIHPGDLGHQYMAYLFLEALKVQSIVSEVHLSYKQQNVHEVVNSSLSKLEFVGTRLSFDLLENALPYPIKKDIPEIYTIVPIESKLNLQLLQVSTLLQGTWSIQIDGVNVGEFSSEDFQKGINLSENSKTPQFIQSQKVLDMNLEYYYQEVKYRDFVKVGIMLKGRNIDLNNDTEIKSFFETFPSTEGKYAEEYYNQLFSRYFDNKQNLIANKEKLKSLFQQLYSCNQPITHHYEIFKV